ncbi:MAG TPA: FAD-dependent oxidoreductase [Xanthobacteraceae bacterium]|nr:FAD-dependent oxidoreductase [Xanthobacteraceae bacterium]
MAATLLTPDICVIGAGAGGMAVAAAAATFRAPVVLVEQSKMGGEHLNYGCVPSKELLAVARRFADLKNLPGFGIGVENPQIDFAVVRAHVQDAIRAVSPNSSAERFAGLGVQVVLGSAQFTDHETIAVGDDIVIKARRTVIATGSSPATPLMPGLDTVEFLNNETIFDLAERPDHLIVIGAGTVGLEFAQAFRRFGAAVSVIEARTPLGGEDPECVDVVLAALMRDGIAVHAGATVKGVAKTDTGVAVTFETPGGVQTVVGSHLLITAGRRPNIEALNLQAAGIKFDANGIIVNRHLRTSNKSVYAVGDVAGGPRLTNAATYHAGLVARNALFRTSDKADDTIIPRVTFTDPELAHVGISEAEAHKKHRKVHILRWSYHDNDRAQIERAPQGHIKVIADKNGTILSATIVGAQAGEMISLWALAIAQKLNIRSIAELVAPYPTLSDISKRIAINFYAPSVKSSFLQRVIAWLRWWG